VSSLLAPAWICALSVALLPACLDWDTYQHGRCGDGFVGPEERCDDRNTTSGDGCSATCELEPPACGNGRMEANEECDDRNTMSGDGCSATCEDEPEPPGPACGDGELDDDEVCDDGNTANTDSCLKGCSRATCGDGFVRAQVEECDVSASDEGKACTPACLACGAEPEGYYRAVSRHCFTRHLEALTQAEARAACQSEDGELWTITAPDEGEVTITRLALEGQHWLGLVAQAMDTHWVTGEPFDVENFAAGEPGAMPPGCVTVLADGGDNAWQGAACDKKLPFVCERAAPFVDFASNHAYKLHTHALPIDEARARSKSEGGALATLESDAERAFLAPKITLKVWVDASEVANGKFQWSTGAAVDAALFRPGQPDGADGAQDCLLLEPKKRLADELCSANLAYVCEYD
jgi:cysteine-rich repeat protein